MEINERVKGSFYGLAIGDALGVPAEFMHRDEVRKINLQEMEGEDTNFSQKYNTRWGDIAPKGCWSDDTAMTLAVMDAYCNDDFKYSDIMDNFITWWKTGKYSSLDYAFGMGGCCVKAMQKYLMTNDINTCGCDNIRENGNGALMRILPTCLYIRKCNIDLDKKIELLNFVTAITHAHPISKMADVIYYLFLDNLMNTNDKYNAFDYIINFDYSKYFDKETIDVYSHILNKEFLKIKDIEEKKNGYVVPTLEGVLFSVMNNDNFRDSVLCAINLGFDTDTLAAITGSLAGILYGYNSIPKSWIRDLRKKDLLDEMVLKFCKKTGYMERK